MYIHVRGAMGRLPALTEKPGAMGRSSALAGLRRVPWAARRPLLKKPVPCPRSRGHALRAEWLGHRPRRFHHPERSEGSRNIVPDFDSASPKLSKLPKNEGGPGCGDFRILAGLVPHSTFRVPAWCPRPVILSEAKDLG